MFCSWSHIAHSNTTENQYVNVSFRTDAILCLPVTVLGNSSTSQDWSSLKSVSSLAPQPSSTKPYFSPFPQQSDFPFCNMIWSECVDSLLSALSPMVWPCHWAQPCAAALPGAVNKGVVEGTGRSQTDSGSSFLQYSVAK